MQIELFYKGLALFCLPSSALNKNVQFFLIYRDEGNEKILHLMPNSISGRTEVVDKKLEEMFL
jgi:hypothetical protein